MTYTATTEVENLAEEAVVDLQDTLEASKVRASEITKQLSIKEDKHQ